MRTLLLHPADDPETGPWAGQAWTRIIDLGLGGSNTYDHWQRRFRCKVVSLSSYRRDFQEAARVRELLAMGQGQLVDRDGLDWWELTAILVHSQLETLVLLQRLVDSLERGEELHITRSGFYADALGLLLGSRVSTFPTKDGSQWGPVRYLQLGIKFPLWQLAQMFWDKYDPEHQIRGRFARKARPSRVPVVLLPSAYVNVTRTGIAYAKTVPDLKFLLVATRKSGWAENLPPNVSASWFAAYASLRPDYPANDCEEIIAKWKVLRPALEEIPEIGMLGRLGLMNGFPAWLKQGIKQRDIWKAVLRDEPVQAVLCADDSNPSTHIPVLLARKSGLPAIACHHGALDGRYMIKQNHADVVLAKGKMEEDYLVRVCGVPAGEVEIGAPARSAGPPLAGTRDAAAIILFSELYEAFSGRSEEFYRDVLPPLAELAIQTGKRLVVKLHPAESQRERQRLVNRVLSPGQRSMLTVMGGSTTPELLKTVWFGITVLSTVASECAELGIPCFLCKWLEFWPYGYIDQFIRFGVGHGLDSPAEIAQIPQILETYKVGANVAQAVSRPIEVRRLQQLLTTGPARAAVAQNVVERAG